MPSRAAALAPTLLVGCCFAVGGLHVLRPSAEYAGFIHGYWMDHWLLGYGSGFVRRGLLGAVADAAGLTSHAFLVHAAAVSVVLGLATAVWYRLRPHLPSAEPAAMVIWIALALSPMASIFWETLGDPLHIVLLATIAAMEVIPRLSTFSAMAVAVGVVVPCVAVHEAATFVAAPALALQIVRLPQDSVPRPGRMLGAGALVTAAVAAACGVIAAGEVTVNQRRELLPAMRIATGNGEYRTGAASFLFQSFSELRSHMPRGAADSAGLAVRSVIVPGILTAMLMVAWGEERHRALRRSFVASLVLLGLGAMPLFFVARDWGRFAIYVWWLALLVTVSRHAPAPLARRAAGSLVGLAGLLLAIGPINPIYRAAGLTNRSALAFFVLVPGVWAYSRWAVSRR